MIYWPLMAKLKSSTFRLNVPLKWKNTFRVCCFFKSRHSSFKNTCPPSGGKEPLILSSGLNNSFWMMRVNYQSLSHSLWLTWHGEDKKLGCQFQEIFLWEIWTWRGEFCITSRFYEVWVILNSDDWRCKTKPQTAQVLCLVSPASCPTLAAGKGEC